MNKIVYITPEQAKATHAKTIEYSGGGTLEELDFGKLEGVLCNIQNDDWYPEFVDKLTHLFFCVCQFHCFADGNNIVDIISFIEWIFRNCENFFDKDGEYKLKCSCK